MQSLSTSQMQGSHEQILGISHDLTCLMLTLYCMQLPSTGDIQKKLSGPLGALPNPKDLANKAKVNTPNVDNLASKVTIPLC